jgi:hypothetical protein
MFSFSTSNISSTALLFVFSNVANGLYSSLQCCGPKRSRLQHQVVHVPRGWNLPLLHPWLNPVGPVLFTVAENSSRTPLMSRLFQLFTFLVFFFILRNLLRGGSSRVVSHCPPKKRQTTYQRVELLLNDRFCPALVRRLSKTPDSS